MVVSFNLSDRFIDSSPSKADNRITKVGVSAYIWYMSSQISKLPKKFASIIQPAFPYTAPNDGFCTLRLTVASAGVYYLYITINGVLLHPFCGYGGTNWQDSRTFAFRKGDVLGISESGNCGNFVADIILFK